MNRLFPVLPLLVLLVTACSDKSAETGLPSFAEAAQKYKQESKAKMEKMAPEDLAVMKQAGESLAERLPDPGIKIGEKAPDFTLPDAFGKPVKLSGLLKDGPVVLVFYRGAWCPYCNMHLHVLNESLPEFKRLGAQLVTITPQKPDISADQIKKSAYPFKVLSDLDNSVMKGYRLYYELGDDLVKVYNKLGLDVAKFNGPGRYGLPVPGSFVIDQKGFVRARHATTDYTQRMEPAAIIKALEDLKG